MRNQLVAKALELGFQTAGICSVKDSLHSAHYAKWIAQGNHASMEYLAKHEPIKRSPRNLMPEAKSMLVVSLNYYQPFEYKPGEPRIARYALGRDYHRVVRQKLQRLLKWAKQKYAGLEGRVCVDSAPLLEREYAQRAGIGWFGKNTMLIDSRRGSWFVIGSLLLNYDLAPSKAAYGGCGTCTKCIEACPTGAIVKHNGRWQVDSRRCISYLTIEHKGDFTEEQSKMVGTWTFGCDVCQEVCPFNEQRESQPLRAQETSEPDFLERRKWPSLKQILELDKTTWDTLTAGSPVRRAGFDGLLRNAMANLANADTP